MTEPAAPDLPTDLDELMSLNPLDLTPADREAYLTTVITYHRNIRAAKEKGVKVPRAKRGAAEGVVKPKLTLGDLGIAPARPVVKIDRRV